MATPSGTIGLSDVNIELGYPSTDLISMNDAAVRTLADVPSGTISMNDLRGKSNRVTITLTIASDTTNYDLYTAVAPSYSAGKSDIFLTINPGVNVYSNSTGTAAVAVPSSFTTGDVITITNNGTIVGRGGNGGNGALAGSPGGTGGTGLAVAYPTTVANNNQIAGGGGGGGGGGNYPGPTTAGGGGGGAAYGSGGSQNGNPAGFSNAGTGGGGNSFYYAPYAYAVAGNGGAGGTWGSSGSAGNAGYYVEFGFYPGGPGGSGGATGNSITGNSYITWTANGTKTGPVS